MIGLGNGSKNPLRTHSIVSPNYEDDLTSLSIKAPRGRPSSKFKHSRPCDEIIVGDRHWSGEGACPGTNSSVFR